MFQASPAVAGLLLFFAAALCLAQGDTKRGEYLAKVGGCLGCHTEEKENAPPYAGGRALKTPFGTFFGPNITPHPQAGIGRWTEADFVRALREGRRPDGAHYFPAFPYPSFTLIADVDLRNLWAYFRTVPPSSRQSEPHQLGFLYRWRFLVGIWKWLFFTRGPFAPDSAKSAVLNRGRYLVTALGHCGECHTPRNFLGAPKQSQFLAGAKDVAPNLTPTRLKNWSDADLRNFLTTGLTADGDVPAKEMGEVITNTTSQLTAEDLNAIIAFLRSVPPLPAPAK
ncbi:MAG TPA: cytochrome c [Burkholderiales bacterium]|nr:cytochrome c [Burkholderiales bacterium]